MKTLALVAFALLLEPVVTSGQAADALLARVKQERGAFLKTLQELVSIESGSRDIEGLNRLSEVIAGRLRALGGDVQFVAPGTDVRFDDTPAQIGRMVLARFKGTGTRRILLLAHMDTVYERGMGAKQPFRIEGDRAYGLGIADDKQGVALILHTLAMLQAMKFQQYGTLTVLITGDEEISAPGSRGTLTRLGREHDVVLSAEGGGSTGNDRIELATTGSGALLLKVTGRASHAGQAPEQGRNALYEMAHQIMQMRDLSDPATGVKLNWTVASAGTVRNIIPAAAQAMADVRVQRQASWDGIERRVRERVSEDVDPGHQGRRGPRATTAAARADRRVATRSAPTPRRSTQGWGGPCVWPPRGRAAPPMPPSPRSRARRRSSRGSACKVLARIRTTPNTCCSVLSSRASTFFRA